MARKCGPTGLRCLQRARALRGAPKSQLRPPEGSPLLASVFRVLPSWHSVLLAMSSLRSWALLAALGAHVLRCQEGEQEAAGPMAPDAHSACRARRAPSRAGLRAAGTPAGLDAVSPVERVIQFDVPRCPLWEEGHSPWQQQESGEGGVSGWRAEACGGGRTAGPGLGLGG